MKTKTIIGCIVAETKKAVRVDMGGAASREAWIPKSVIKSRHPDERYPDMQIIQIESWFPVKPVKENWHGLEKF